ncbi:hypothetical protein PHMEG_00022067 [Phytophthora megakarya]|uniref:Uncharacterized protein n=1 Tax=Phytophthora megakarya TaxID=4795 RepID=A0A225VKB7_9STRA|nr:hypothetical protein PHMEG_00022067 [Phytophthora megakarya]
MYYISYRYTIIVNDNKELSIGMEDRSTKLQWFKGGMKISDYVTSDNAIFGASAGDYATCIHEVLARSEVCSDYQRELSVLEDSALALLLRLQYRVFDAVLEAKFSFQLDPVSIERIDILESKLRDHQEQIDVLASQLTEQRETVKKVDFKATEIVPGSLSVRWTGTGSNDLATVDSDGAVKVHRSGLYHIEAVVEVAEEDDDDGDYIDDEDENGEDAESAKTNENDDEDGGAHHIFILKNHECIREQSVTGNCLMVCSTVITHLKDGDELLVKTELTLDATSTLVITRLAD